jgi:TonB family protein
MPRALAPLVIFFVFCVVACAAPAPSAPRSRAPTAKKCDGFTPCPAGQRCLLGSCEPIDCRATAGCVELGRCSLRDGRCVAATDGDCRSAAVCRRLGMCRAFGGGCGPATTDDYDCGHRADCDASGLCLCALQRNLGRPAAPPALSPAAVKAAAKHNLAGLQRCYERLLRRKPDLAGTAVFDVTVSSDGKVDRVQCVSISAASVDLAACILDQVRTWTFRPPPGETVVFRYPVTFRSEP